LSGLVLQVTPPRLSHRGTISGLRQGRLVNTKHGAQPEQDSSGWYPDFTNRPDQKTKGLNPGDSANPNTTMIFACFAQIQL
jgi:hypothetical protein